MVGVWVGGGAWWGGGAALLYFVHRVRHLNQCSSNAHAFIQPRLLMLMPLLLNTHCHHCLRSLMLLALPTLLHH